ncbi:YeiH family protein [Cellulomonas sp. SG140]|uniref:YeiH family protein n=1 Tax=Cellulomonas sp. SG140 TaxID=2976536 RepID=UPI0021E8301A|nr:putative sulfate exporter family transporter [Cellulomonas sp. SG140]
MTTSETDAPPLPTPPARSVRTAGPGLAVAVLLGAAATWVGILVPVVGGPVVGIVLGVLCRELLLRRAPWSVNLDTGARIASKQVLQAAVVLLGLGLSLSQVLATGRSALPVMLGTLAVGLAGAAVLGRRLGLDRETRTLVGVGTAICGASAIAATSAVIGASEVAVATSVTTIFLFNALAAVLFPVVGHLLGLSQAAFGLWAGTAVNDASSVVAAGTVFGASALATAVVVKLTRTLMIVPITLTLAVGAHRRARAAAGAAGQRGPTVRWTRLVPPFLVLFLVAAAVNSAHAVPTTWQPGLAWTARLLTAVALAGVGLLTPVEGLRRAGWRPLALGGALWLAVASSSLALQGLTGRL